MTTNLPVIVLDFETYFDAEYSLEKLSTAVYVSDLRFQVLGLATMYDCGRTEFRVDVEAALRELQERYGPRLEGALVVMHNAAFDYYILHHRYGITITNIVDTCALSRLVNGPTQPAGLADLAALHDLPRKGALAFAVGVRCPNPEQLEQLAAYACRDVEITRRLLDLYLPMAMRTPSELTIMAHTARMLVERPFSVDTHAVEEGRAVLDAHVAGLVAATGRDRAAISGTRSFAALLTAVMAKTGRSIPLKPGKHGDIPAFSKTDDAMVQLLGDADESVRRLAAARLAVQSAAAQAKRFDFLRKSAAACGGKLHAKLVYHGAHTGRFTGGDGFNLQNLADPERSAGDLDKQVRSLLRQAICAPPGFTLVGCDARQIEARVLAWMAPEPALHQAFADGTDVYCEFASQVFRQPVIVPAQSSPDYAHMRALRAVGKTAVLALGYGMGAQTFTDRLRWAPEARRLFAEGVLTSDSCRQIVDQYRTTFTGITAFWRRCESAFRDAVSGQQSVVSGVRFFKVGGDVFIELPSGRRMRYPKASLHVQDRAEFRQADDDDFHDLGPCRTELVYTDLRTGSDVALFGGKLVNNVVSGTARDLLVKAIIRLERQGWRVIAHIHDAIVVECAPERADECQAAMVSAWRAVPAWATGLVLDAEAEVGRSLADVG